jgi:hypothetical protein
MPISAPSPVHVEPATAPAETSAVPAMSVTALPNVEVAAPDVRAARTATVAAPRAAAPATEVADLRAELLALDAVRAATDDGRPRKALALLDGYASKYKTGKLREEASVLRIEALAAAGERESARRLADRFLRESPTTIYTARVRAAVARVPSPEQP